MSSPFQPNTPLYRAIYQACDALALMAGTERPDINVDPEWTIQKKGCHAVVSIQESGQLTVVWGNIGGTIANQSDLVAALALKSNISTISAVGFSGQWSDVINKPLFGTAALKDVAYFASADSISAVGYSGQWSDIIGKPTFGTATAEDVGYFATAAQGSLADSALQPGDSVTDMYMQTGKLLGRSTAATGAVEELTVGSGLTLSAGTLSAAGGSGLTQPQVMARAMGV